MFEILTELEIALLYRALNTERNLVERYLHRSTGGNAIQNLNTEKVWLDQLDAIGNLLNGIDVEYERRYVERNPA